MKKYFIIVRSTPFRYIENSNSIIIKQQCISLTMQEIFSYKYRSLPHVYFRPQQRLIIRNLFTYNKFTLFFLFFMSLKAEKALAWANQIALYFFLFEYHLKREKNPICVLEISSVWQCMMDGDLTLIHLFI